MYNLTYEIYLSLSRDEDNGDKEHTELVHRVFRMVNDLDRSLSYLGKNIKTSDIQNVSTLEEKLFRHNNHINPLCRYSLNKQIIPPIVCSPDNHLFNYGDAEQFLDSDLFHEIHYYVDAYYDSFNS
jgi:hypothetical protein